MSRVRVLRAGVVVDRQGDAGRREAPEAVRTLEDLRRPPLRNTRGEVVGRIEVEPIPRRVRRG